MLEVSGCDAIECSPGFCFPRRPYRGDCHRFVIHCDNKKGQNSKADIDKPRKNTRKVIAHRNKSSMNYAYLSERRISSNSELEVVAKVRKADRRADDNSACLPVSPRYFCQTTERKTCTKANLVCRTNPDVETF